MKRTPEPCKGFRRTLSGLNIVRISDPGFSLRSNPGLKLANAFGVFQADQYHFSPSSLRLDRILHHMIACDNEELILVVEDHPECHALHIDEVQVPATTVEHLNAFDVANVDAAMSVHGNRIRSAKLARLVTGTAKTIHELSIASKLEDAVVESAKRVDITSSVNGDAHA